MYINEIAKIEHKGIISSGGFQTTSQENTVITFVSPLNQLIFTGIDNINIKLNNETNYHYIPAGYTMEFDKIRIEKIEIKENAVQYMYNGSTF